MSRPPIRLGNPPDPVLHEVGRALRGAVFRLHRGGAARPQQLALIRSWLAPAAGDARLLVITARGRAALAAPPERRTA